MFNFVSGRNLLLVLPVLALSACSIIEQPLLPEASSVNYGHYDQGCAAGTCAPGQSYSVAGGANPNHWPDMGHVPGYESGGHYGHKGGHGGYGHNGYGHNGSGQGPVHVNPTGYGHSLHGGPQAYGQPPFLRGTRGIRGNKGPYTYGTLGGVMYDTKLDSFGLQGRIGYDSGRPLLWGGTIGVEGEGSIGLTNDTSDGSNGFSDFSEGVDYNYGIYAVERAHITPRFSLLGRVGYNAMKYNDDFTEDLTAIRNESSYTLDGVAYGVGAEFNTSPNSGLRLDYTITDTERGKLETVAASLVKKF